MTDPSLPLTWVLLRSSGVVTILLLTIALAVGLLSPVIRRPDRRLVAISTHTTAAALGVLLLVVHVAMAVADSYVTISAWAIVIPGMSQWEPALVGLGALAVDLLIAVTVTSAARRWMPIRWRAVHLLVLPAWALAWGHALTAGTDARAPEMLWAAVASGVVVVAAATWRLLAPARDRAQRGLTPARKTRSRPSGALSGRGAS